MTGRRAFLRLLRLLAPYWRWAALAVALGFGTIASSIGLMAASAWIITRAALQPSIAVLQVAIVSVRAFGIARGVFRYLERLVAHEVTFRLLAGLRVWFYRALEPLAPARLMQYQSGDLLTRLVADIETLQEFYGRVVAPPLTAVLVGSFIAVFLWGYDPRLTLVALAFFVAAGVGAPLVARWLSRAPGRDLVRVRAALNTASVDGVLGAADLIAFGQEARQVERIAALSADLIARQRRMAWIAGLQSALGSLAVSFAVLAVLWAAIPVVEGIDLAVLALATLASFEAVLPLPAAFQNLESSLEAMRRLTEIIDAEPVIVDPATPAALPADLHQGAFDLTVEGLCFRYAAGAPPALDGVSFTVAQGRCVAVVGPSGAGKSTLVNLLLRFWDYEEGRIALGGRDLRAYRQDDVRRVMAVVTQQTHLFNASIRDNLLIGNPDATEAMMVEAARAARLHDFVCTLPEGYDTRVGELGMRLSGGERQRVALARALLKDAPILICDEATANLDAQTEREIMHTLQSAMAGRAALIITHRLVGLEAADEILVLRAGRVVQRGRHAALIEDEGLYRRLWTQQNRVLAERAAPPG
ncbi:MAG: thiol reductant ABC exporter subunit CydC [Anaerolineae bacterium]|nr:thiol reductant ABC exporter subunit CydC [Anaerolineae bacterium]